MPQHGHEKFIRIPSGHMDYSVARSGCSMVVPGRNEHRPGFKQLADRGDGAKLSIYLGPAAAALDRTKRLLVGRSELSIVTVDGRGEGFAHYQSLAVHAAVAIVASPRNGAVSSRQRFQN